MKNYSDISDLIAQLVIGDNEAWSYFLRQYGRLIYFFINKYHRRASQEDKDDCFQEILKILLAKNCRRLQEIHTLEEYGFLAAFYNFSPRGFLVFLENNHLYPLVKLCGDIYL